MRTKLIPLTIAAGASAVTCAAYLKDLRAAKRRIATGSQVIDGAIEFAESGDGPPLLVIHGAGGGFDQGLEIGRAVAGAHRIIAPSRFGYLGTPLPEDASPAAQAKAHVRLLDALGIDRAPVIGISAGGPSALQFALRYPDRCSALILMVPLAWSPERANVQRPRYFGMLIKAIASSDFIFWTALKLAHSALVQTILGTPIDDYRRATPAERRKIDGILRDILPISRRVDGIGNDSAVGSSLMRYPLQDIRVRTLVIGAENCLYGTWNGCVYAAQQIPGARLVGFKDGGHLIAGHEDEVRLEIAAFLESQAGFRPTPQIQPFPDWTSIATEENPALVNS